MKLFAPQDWKDYELLDSGNFEKLERFGAYITRRPEPQAVWSPYLPSKEWDKAHATYLPDGSHKGNWKRDPKMPDQWYLPYHSRDFSIKFRLGLTGFKHVGIFPEQAVNWDYIHEKSRRIPNAKVLNLFAYTGGASLAARAAGANVIHCDSIKNVVSWASANMEASKLKDIRWLVEDAFKFVKREARRGNTYNGIILDPPAYGHGPKGEKWKLEDMINELMGAVAQILDKDKYFLVLNSYSLGFSPLVLQGLAHSHFDQKIMKKAECGELYLPERSGRKLPAGIFLRFSNV
ncbi:MAG: class I SAM-dependent methyltransferase [Bacteroidia bacterium]